MQHPRTQSSGDGVAQSWKGTGRAGCFRERFHQRCSSQTWDGACPSAGSPPGAAMRGIRRDRGRDSPSKEPQSRSPAPLARRAAAALPAPSRSVPARRAFLRAATRGPAKSCCPPRPCSPPVCSHPSEPGGRLASPKACVRVRVRSSGVTPCSSPQQQGEGRSVRGCGFVCVAFPSFLLLLLLVVLPENYDHLAPNRRLPVSVFTLQRRRRRPS